MSEQLTSHPLRCFCSRQPLLATYGLTADGRAYLHVKVYKQRRIYGNIMITGGTIEMQCRECLRWYRVDIVAGKPSLTEVDGISTTGGAESPLVDDGPTGSRRAKVTVQDD